MQYTVIFHGDKFQMKNFDFLIFSSKHILLVIFCFFGAVYIIYHMIKTTNWVKSRTLPIMKVALIFHYKAIGKTTNSF